MPVHPDIDAAWAEGIANLRAAQIDLTDYPLFLVLGRSAAGVENLFDSAQVPLIVRASPPEGPVQFCAGDEGIYICCPGTCAMAYQAELLATESAPAPAEDDFYQTLRPKAGQQREIQAVLARAKKEGRPLDAKEKEELRRLSSGSKSSLLRDTDDIQALAQRLERLCQLIVEARQPYCPLNGILTLIPYPGLARPEVASQFGQLMQQELDIVRTTLRVNCPILALICDLETAPGFRDFIERFPADQRQRRLGLRLPHSPDLDPEQWQDMLVNAALWICQSLMPSWVYRLVRLDPPGTDTLGNASLMHLLAEFYARADNLATILGSGIPLHPPTPPLFGGCYLAGTGADPQHEQAFAPGVFRRLLEDQNFVSWTAEAIAEDARNQRLANLGTTVLAILTVALASIAGFVFFR
ncbi:MAG: type VI secretion protein IcmF/TssM N-terminal domain-containing protein [Gemmataceae bacterium]